jgi:alpha-ketoglutarate-dependent taurine dioxygenase
MIKNENSLETIYHPVINKNYFNGQDSLYLGGEIEDIFKLIGTSKVFTTKQLIEDIIKTHGYYEHHYEVGDLLIWDNI